VVDDSERLLVVLIGGRRAGVITMDPAGRFSFTYDEVWRDARNATPLSLSMPIAQLEHGDTPVRAFLWGLLPDNERVLERWAQTYHVSARNPFALLRHVGEDCAGAAQFVTPERVEALMAGDGDVRWLNADDIAERLRILRSDPTAWHVYNTGQFSLAGAQAKTALHYDRHTRRWGEPWGAVPTTHILKPAVTGLDDHDLNEHICLSAARLIGLSAASSQVASFGTERCIVVERYDRLWTRSAPVTRVHQEDTCQAIALPPTSKYQSDGGPAPEQIIGLLRRNILPSTAADENVRRFIDALAFNWIIGGTDAHAKNYSVLLAGPQVRLAPLYDVASTLVYDDIYAPRLRMAMKIGGEYRMQAISGRHWRRFATTNRLDPDEIIDRLDSLTTRTPDAFATAAKRKAVRALRSRLPSRLVERIAARAADCRKGLQQ
jgi:serine/threonine-protein kinase HipA